MAAILYINDIEVDVSKFKHPGGNVITYYYGQDATHVFNAFHHRSKKAKNILNKLVKKETQVVVKNSNDVDMLEDFDKWRQSLIDRGFFDPSVPHVIYRMLEILGIFVFSTYLCYLNYWRVSILGFGVFGGRCGWIQHEAGHGSFTCIKSLDKHIQKMTMGFGLSTSGRVWNNMHNRHHACTQKIGYDADLDTSPFVAFYNKAVENGRSKSYSKEWMKWQAYTFLPITSGILVMMFWIFVLHPYKVIKERDYVQAGWIASSHIIFSAIYRYFLGWTWIQGWTAFIATKWVSSVYLFGHFSTSHSFLDVVEKESYPTWVDYALSHTVDIDTQNRLVCWLMGYLNCQCVHHLFPQMPQFRQPIVSKELALFAKKWNKPYIVLGYIEAWRLTFKNLNNVGLHYYEL
jgi:fatty acid desaturase 2 (delta-6 desaturase)